MTRTKRASTELQEGDEVSISFVTAHDVAQLTNALVVAQEKHAVMLSALRVVLKANNECTGTRLPSCECLTCTVAEAIRATK